MARARMPRKVKDHPDRRFYLRVSEEVYWTIRMKAEKEGISMTRWIGQRLAEAAKKEENDE